MLFLIYHFQNVGFYFNINQLCMFCLSENTAYLEFEYAICLRKLFVYDICYVYFYATVPDSATTICHGSNSAANVGYMIQRLKYGASSTNKFKDEAFMQNNCGHSGRVFHEKNINCTADQFNVQHEKYGSIICRGVCA